VSRAYESNELTDGRWVLVGNVQRWVPDPPPPEPEPAVPPGEIACPTCNATLMEPCRNPGGKSVKSHIARHTPKLCACGDYAERGSPYCGKECRNKARREQWHAYSQRRDRASEAQRQRRRRTRELREAS